MYSNIESVLAEILAAPNVPEDGRDGLLERTQLLMRFSVALSAVIGAESLILLAFKDDGEGRVYPLLHASTNKPNSTSQDVMSEIAHRIADLMKEHPKIWSDNLFSYDHNNGGD